MALSMVRQGMFGGIVHCQGGYRHDFREEIHLGERINTIAFAIIFIAIEISYQQMKLEQLQR